MSNLNALKKKAALAKDKLSLDLDRERMDLEAQTTISKARYKVMDSFQEDQSTVSA